MNLQELKDRRDKASSTLESIREQMKQLVSYEAQLIGRLQTYDELIEEEQNAKERETVSIGRADTNSGHSDT